MDTDNRRSVGFLILSIYYKVSDLCMHEVQRTISMLGLGQGASHCHAHHRPAPAATNTVGRRRLMRTPPSALIPGFEWTSHEELKAKLLRLAESTPDLARLTTIGQSALGRDLLLLEIGREPDRTRPAVCITAGLHAMEFIGIQAALTLCERLV